MNTAAHTIQVPESLAQYHERAMSVLRYQYGPGPFGPRNHQPPMYNSQQMKFLSDIAHAFHNLTGESGVEFFYTEAGKINAAWQYQRAELLADRCYGHFFEKLWPLPEKP